ncbi:hypothetical protein CGK43_23005 [Vibrio parahaemolyticus]|nr:hypothetical protein CGK43_23005 [Vibrio parahaemolyticus]
MVINLASNITKRLRGILNAWQFWFKVKFLCVWHNVLVLGLRCSPLNAALVLDGHQRLKVSVFIGFFFLLYTWSNVPFTFFPVALYVECSL